MSGPHMVSFFNFEKDNPLESAFSSTLKFSTTTRVVIKTQSVEKFGLFINHGKDLLISASTFETLENQDFIISFMIKLLGFPTGRPRSMLTFHNFHQTSENYYFGGLILKGDKNNPIFIDLQYDGNQIQITEDQQFSISNQDIQNHIWTNIILSY